MYWIIIAWWKTGELHRKLVGNNFKASRRRCFLIQCVWVQWLKFFSLEMIEDAIRQTDKTITNMQTTNYLEKYVFLGDFLLISISPVYLVRKQDFIQARIHAVAYICQASQTLDREQHCPMLPCPVVKTTPW